MMKRSTNHKTGPVELPLYMTTDDIAQLLRVTPRHVVDVISKKPGFPQPRSPTKVKLYQREHVLQWVESQVESK